MWRRLKGLAQVTILILATLVLWISHRLNTPTNAWWSSLLQNFGAGLCSALVLIWLYDQIIERESNRVRAERNRIAASQLIAPLRSQIYGLLFPMYRSATAKKQGIKSWREFLTVHFPEEMPNLDISIRSPGSYPQVTPYPKFISDNMSRFSLSLQSWLSKYGAVADADLVEPLEQVIGSSFMVLSSGLEQITNVVPSLPLPAPLPFSKLFTFERSMCQEYGARLSALVDAVERKLPSPISKFEEMYWHNAALGIGYARKAGTH
jgi:hypothetical protein